MAIRHLDTTDRLVPRLRVLDGSSSREANQRQRRHWLTVACVALSAPFVAAVISLGVAH
jgi:hypothetical protein